MKMHICYCTNWNIISCQDYGNNLSIGLPASAHPVSTQAVRTSHLKHKSDHVTFLLSLPVAFHLTSSKSKVFAMDCKVLWDLPPTPFTSSPLGRLIHLQPHWPLPTTFLPRIPLDSISPQLQVSAPKPAFPGCFLWPLFKITAPIPGIPYPPSLLYFYIFHQPAIYFT